MQAEGTEGELAGGNQMKQSREVAGLRQPWHRNGKNRGRLFSQGFTKVCECSPHGPAGALLSGRLLGRLPRSANHRQCRLLLLLLLLLWRGQRRRHLRRRYHACSRRRKAEAQHSCLAAAIQGYTPFKLSSTPPSHQHLPNGVHSEVSTLTALAEGLQHGVDGLKGAVDVLALLGARQHHLWRWVVGGWVRRAHKGAYMLPTATIPRYSAPPQQPALQQAGTPFR